MNNKLLKIFVIFIKDKISEKILTTKVKKKYRNVGYSKISKTC